MRHLERARRDAISRAPLGVRGIQIGPRIRIGGTVGKIGEEIKKVIPSPAALTGYALGGGVGQLVGSAANGTLGEDAAKGARNAALVLPVANSFGSSGGGTSAPSGADGSDNPLDPSNFPATGSSTGGSSGVLDEIGGFLKQYGGDIVGGIAAFAKKYGTTALEAYNIYEAAQRQAKAEGIANDAIKTATKQYADKAPLRTAGQSGMLNPSANTPDLSNIRNLSTVGSGNPFAKALPVAGVATKPPGYSPTGTLNALPVAPNPSAPSGFTPTGSSTPLPQSQVDSKNLAGTLGSTNATVNYGGKQYTQSQWSDYTKANPGWSTPTAPAAAAPRLPVAPSPTPTTPRLTLPVAGAVS